VLAPTHPGREGTSPRAALLANWAGVFYGALGAGHFPHAFTLSLQMLVALSVEVALLVHDDFSGGSGRRRRRAAGRGARAI
jgi:hypothetical protein